MISVDEAVSRITGAFAVLPAETVGVADAYNRVLAEDITARLDHPPAPMSAMDGYAVRAADATPGMELSVVGASPAGHPFEGEVLAGQAVRVFTGGVVPQGADTVIMQEDSTPGRRGSVVIKEAARKGDNVRERGLDFKTGELLFARGHRISARDISLLASADTAELRVTRKPKVALVATGDELSRPGENRGPGGIVASSTYAMQAMVRNWGGDAVDMGILRDKPEEFIRLARSVGDADLIVTQGGASVGEHDLVQSALGPLGFTLDFWKIAMRPGKPLIFGRLKNTPVLGVPGNPVSAMVCSILFLEPAIATMLGTEYRAPIMKAKLGAPLKANGKRQDYLRAKLRFEAGVAIAEPFKFQDSSMQKVFARSDALIIRKVHAPAAHEGDEVDVLRLDRA